MSRLLLVGGVFAISTATPLIRWAEPAPALLVAFGRVAVAACVLALIAGRDLGLLGAMTRREKLLCALAGVFLGTHFGLWVSSLYFTSTAASVALVATNPIWAALFGWLTLREGISRSELVGIALACTGCAVLAGGDIGGGSDPLIGDALALAGAMVAAAYLVVGRGLRNAVPLVAYLAAINAIAAVVLAAAMWIDGTELTGYAGTDYLAIALAGLTASVLGHTVLNFCVRRVPVHLVALAILGEPVGASLMTWGFFGEVPPVHAAAGGLIVLFGIWLGFARPSR